jgi:hypothetical protein
MTEGRIRLSWGSALVQTAHRQPIIGTPELVPVPRKSNSIDDTDDIKTVIAAMH